MRKPRLSAKIFFLVAFSPVLWLLPQTFFLKADVPQSSCAGVVRRYHKWLSNSDIIVFRNGVYTVEAGKFRLLNASLLHEAFGFALLEPGSQGKVITSPQGRYYYDAKTRVGKTQISFVTVEGCHITFNR